ncbi:MAG: DUF3119 family protein [Synechococcaceae cyanobacterium]|nr:DUF3119 family protein [Synechococcaceae cyanobacterium]
MTLEPRFRVALGVIAPGSALALLALRGAAPGWLLGAGALLALFGVFLLVQTALLRLRFDDDALLVLRGGTEIRRFPYTSWLGWKLFVPGVPVLFYFREERSIHLVPVLFDATTLRRQLEQRLPTPAGPPA